MKNFKKFPCVKKSKISNGGKFQVMSVSSYGVEINIINILDKRNCNFLEKQNKTPRTLFTY